MSAGIRAGSSNDGYVQVNGNDIITALSGGNVGIGVSNPSTKLHVNGTITATNFAGSGGITTDDWIVHASDTDTKLGFPAADQIQFDTGGTNYLKLHRYASVNFVEVGAAASISLANNGANARAILIGDANHTSTGRILMQAGAGSAGHGGAVTLYSHANTTNAGGVYIGKSLNSSGSIILGNGGTSPTHEYLKITSTGKSLFKSQGANAVWISLLDNDSSNEIWRVGQAADGDGYVEVLEDGGTVGCKLDASGNSFTMGNFGVGVASPSTTLEVKGDITVYNANNQGDIFFGENGDVADSKALIRMDQISGTAGELQFHTEGSGTLTKRVTISSTGKLTVSSDSEPQVDVQATSAAGASMRVQSAGAYAYHMAVSTNFHWRWGMPTGTTSFTLRDSTNNRDRFWVDASNGGYFKGTNHTNLEVRSGDASTKAFVQTVQGSDIRIGSSTDHPVNLYTNSLGRLHLHQDGWCLLHTTTLGNNKNGKELVVSYNNDGVGGGDQGRAGITIRSGTNTSSVSQPGYLFFSDGTSGSNESIGGVVYDHASDYMYFTTGGSSRFRITNGGKLALNYAATPPSEDVMICTDGQASEARVSLSHLSGGNRYGFRATSIGGTNIGMKLYTLYNSSYNEILGINGTGATFTGSSTSTISYVFQNGTSAAGADTRLLIKAYANSGADPYIKFDAGGTDMVIGTYYQGTTNNRLVMGYGSSPSGGVTGHHIYGSGEWYQNSAVGQTTASSANAYWNGADGRFLRSTSSIKFKSNVKTLLDSDADKILQCRPVTYQPKDIGDNTQGSDPTKTFYGLIAEEVEVIDPRLVGYDSEGTIQNVEYDRFVPHLINLVKRQSAEIETLKTKVAALESA